MDEQECLATATRHKDVVVGVKIRLQKQISCNGKNEQEAFRLEWFDHNSVSVSSFWSKD